MFYAQCYFLSYFVILRADSKEKAANYFNNFVHNKFSMQEILVMTSVIATDKSLFRNIPSKVNLMKEEGSLRRGFVYGKFRIIISVSSAIFRFR